MVADTFVDKNELLAQAADRAVLAARLTPTAVTDLVEMYKAKCIVTAGVVTLNGDLLDQAVEKLIESRPHWIPVVVVDLAQESLRADQALAIAGNLSAQGRVRRSFGGDRDPQATAAYNKWAASNNVRLGKPANGADNEHATNPWSASPANLDARGRYNGSAMARQSALVKANKDGAAGIAAAVNSKIGDTRPTE